MTLVERWYDFICFAIVGLAFLGALVLIWRTEITKSEPTRRTRTTDLYECLTVITTKAEGSSDTTETDHSLLWKSCWPRLAPAWLLAFRFFSFALLSVVLAIDFLDYGASIFLYYTEYVLPFKLNYLFNLEFSFFLSSSPYRCVCVLAGGLLLWSSSILR